MQSILPWPSLIITYSLFSPFIPEGVNQQEGELIRTSVGNIEPFTFLRGSAALMADDLSRTPNSGIYVQACGDCHLLNFGAFATPERKLVFDINDFDETLPAPWEWDIKRLAVSFAVVAQDNGFCNKDAKMVSKFCVQAYRESLRKYSKMSPLDVWYELVKMWLQHSVVV